ncbi:MAG: hypothetical protein ACR2RL_08795, partial [Gammaproteobacteria bacterium]
MGEIIFLAAIVICIVFGGWLLAVICLFKMAALRKLIAQRDEDVRNLRRAADRAANETRAPVAPDERLHRSMLLRLELDVAQAGGGEFDVRQHRQLDAHLSALTRELLDEKGFEQGRPAWSSEREAAWAMLEQSANVPLGPAPWREAFDTAAQVPGNAVQTQDLRPPVEQSVRAGREQLPLQ